MALSTNPLDSFTLCDAASCELAATYRVKPLPGSAIHAGLACAGHLAAAAATVMRVWGTSKAEVTKL